MEKGGEPEEILHFLIKRRRYESLNTTERHGC
jgi:hypothetical protein